MHSSWLSPKTLQIANEILEWSRIFLMAENEKIHRPYGTQEICPFVAPSISSNAFYMVFHSEVNGASLEDIESVMLSYINEFDLAPPFHPSEQKRKTLLVVFPEIHEKQAHVLDMVHRRTKTAFVKRGLMVGQFHKYCKVPSIHNKSFMVAISPYPLIAIRYMQFHDIIFLKEHDDPSWFDEYNRRFGEHFNEPDKLDEEAKAFVQYYYDAKEKFK